MKNYPTCKELNLLNANHVNSPTDNSHEIVSLIQFHLFAYWVILHALLSAADFFQNQLFRKIISEIPSECQTAWIQIRPNALSGLIWIQTVCKGYQQMKLVDKLEDKELSKNK